MTTTKKLTIIIIIIAIVIVVIMTVVLVRLPGTVVPGGPMFYSFLHVRSSTSVC